MSRASSRRCTIAQPILAAALAVATLAGCTTTKSAAPTEQSEAATASSELQSCGNINVAVSPRLGVEATVGIVAYILEERLGCQVVKKDLSEEVAWQGLGSGDVDVILQDWDNRSMRELYLENPDEALNTAVSLGRAGYTARMGWYVPAWMSEKYPDITDYRQLNKYAYLFSTPESGSMGQLLNADPSFVSMDEALVKNLALNYRVRYSGSERASFEAMRLAQEEGTPLLALLATPSPYMSQLEVDRIDLPATTPGCAQNPATVACDYAPFEVLKVASKSFASEDSAAVSFLREFSWSAEDEAIVGAYMTQDGMNAQEAARRWMVDHRDQVEGWLDEESADDDAAETTD